MCYWPRIGWSRWAKQLVNEIAAYRLSVMLLSFAIFMYSLTTHNDYDYADCVVHPTVGSARDHGALRLQTNHTRVEANRCTKTTSSEWSHLGVHLLVSSKWTTLFASTWQVNESLLLMLPWPCLNKELVFKKGDAKYRLDSISVLVSTFSWGMCSFGPLEHKNLTWSAAQETSASQVTWEMWCIFSFLLLFLKKLYSVLFWPAMIFLSSCGGIHIRVVPM